MLPYNATLADYVAEADALFAGWQAGDEHAVRVFRTKHPKFLDDTIKWLPRTLSDRDARALPMSRDDAALALARHYDFLDWKSLDQYVAEVTWSGPVARFEA